MKVQGSTGPWLLSRRRNPDARVRVYCFPHSGGSPGEYVRWANELPEAEVWAVQAPGRGGRMAEAPITDLDEFVDALTQSVDFQEPFVFFGHSLGALIAFETARRLDVLGRALPERLLLSAMPAPHLDPAWPKTAHLNDVDLLGLVDKTYGTIPEDVRGNTELAALMAPVYRADFQLLSGYSYRPSRPLDVAMTLFGGVEDPVSGQLDAWREHTRHEPEIFLFSGGHFYLREEQRDFMRILRLAVLP
ncbi:thioesterase II family protein [Streptomyces sp. NPDC054787]